MPFEFAVQPALREIKCQDRSGRLREVDADGNQRVFSCAKTCSAPTTMFQNTRWMHPSHWEKSKTCITECEGRANIQEKTCEYNFQQSASSCRKAHTHVVHKSTHMKAHDLRHFETKSCKIKANELLHSIFIRTTGLRPIREAQEWGPLVFLVFALGLAVGVAVDFTLVLALAFVFRRSFDFSVSFRFRLSFNFTLKP